LRLYLVDQYPHAGQSFAVVLHSSRNDVRNFLARLAANARSTNAREVDLSWLQHFTDRARSGSAPVDDSHVVTSMHRSGDEHAAAAGATA
jgi:hypothetical protein